MVFKQDTCNGSLSLAVSKRVTGNCYSNLTYCLGRSREDKTDILSREGEKLLSALRYSRGGRQWVY